jgi:predicted extracellular nuclease
LPLADAPAPTIGPNALGAGVSEAAFDQFTVASFNVQRFYDDVDDPGGDTKLTSANYANRLAKASSVIRGALKSPDVIALEEVEKLSVLQDLANRVNADLGLPANTPLISKRATIPVASTSVSSSALASIP